MLNRLITIARQFLCRHQWKRSRFVNIQTGENLGSLCAKCGKHRP